MARRVEVIRQDLLYCRKCGRHWRGRQRICPNDGADLQPVEPFVGRPGEVIDDRYVIIGEIGVGGMGTVLRAHDRVDEREVALKVLNAEFAGHAASARRFLREARLQGAVRHPAVAEVHRFGRTREGMLVIDLEYVPGTSLRERILATGRPLPVEQGLNLIDDLLGAVGACHAAGIVHCDVKPENVMLIGEGPLLSCKLIDFGIAQEPGPLAEGDDCSIIGTPAYMSPEQVRGQSVDPRTDLYLVGCLTYEVLSGDPPFLGASPIELCQKQILNPPPSLAARLPAGALPPDLEAWSQRLLAKEAGGRPASVAEARADLRALRSMVKDLHADAGLRPPSAARLRARPGERALQPGLRQPITALRALIEVRQCEVKGTIYGPRALEDIARHALAATLADLRSLGGQVQGPRGALIEVHLPCGGDERGVVSHLLDTLASMQARLGRIPEPRLEVRAAVVADLPRPGVEAAPLPGVDLVNLLGIGPGSQVRVDEHVARWAGRRPIARLAALRDEAGSPGLDIYATTLQAA